MNKNKLLAKMVEKGYTQGNLAEIIGIDKATVNKKINGKANFHLEEIQKIREILCLTDEEVLAIFFDEEIA